MEKQLYRRPNLIGSFHTCAAQNCIIRTLPCVMHNFTSASTQLEKGIVHVHVLTYIYNDTYVYVIWLCVDMDNTIFIH